MTQKIRDKVAEDMLWHLTNVMAYEEAVPGSLNMHSFVEESEDGTDGTICGTVCCMKGWLPTTFPAQYKLNKFHSWSIVTVSNNNNPDSSLSYFPGLQYCLASYLFGMGCDRSILEKTIGSLDLASSAKAVKAVWTKAIKLVRAGKLDKYLVE